MGLLKNTSSNFWNTFFADLRTRIFQTEAFQIHQFTVVNEEVSSVRATIAMYLNALLDSNRPLEKFPQSSYLLSTVKTYCNKILEVTMPSRPQYR